jgi:hypothetical protein
MMRALCRKVSVPAFRIPYLYAVGNPLLLLVSSILFVRINSMLLFFSNHVPLNEARQSSKHVGLNTISRRNENGRGYVIKWVGSCVNLDHVEAQENTEFDSKS